MFKLDPSVPHADHVNKDLQAAQIWGPKTVNAGAKASMQDQFDGDPMAAQPVPGAPSLKWVDATQTQLFLSLSYTEAGMVVDNVESIIINNPGPVEPWNFSYTQWGVR